MPEIAQPTLFDETTEAERRAILVANAAKRGYRPAEKWELEVLGPEDLFHAMWKGEQVGPVFVRKHAGATRPTGGRNGE